MLGHICAGPGQLFGDLWPPVGWLGTASWRRAPHLSQGSRRGEALLTSASVLGAGPGFFKFKTRASWAFRRAVAGFAINTWSPGLSELSGLLGGVL